MVDMQKEMMLRLLLKDEIVGYEIKQFDDVVITTHHVKTLNEYADTTNECYIAENYLDYDSFELGIKVGDMWRFEGDLFKLQNRTEKIYVLYYQSQSIDKVCAFDYVYWQLRGKFDEIDLCWGLVQCKGNHIGNLHDNPELLTIKD